MAIKAPQHPDDVGPLVTRARAALRIWIAAVRCEADPIDTLAAAMRQTALGVVIDALAAACDAETGQSDVSFLPLYRARDLLELVDRVLWAARGGDAPLPSQADLLDTAELAAATLAKFDVGACAARTPVEKVSNVVSLTLVRNEGPRPVH